MNKINKLEINRLSDKVYDALKERIINLSLKPGEQLVETDIADELGVSKSPIRDAFHRLERERLVYMIPYKGWYVQAISIEEFEKICEAREAMELFCLSRSLNSYSDKDFQEFVQILELAKKELANGNAFLAFQAHRDFHLKIIKKLNNHLIEHFYLNIWDKYNRYSYIIAADMPARIAIANQEHFALLETFKKKDVNAAIDHLKLHLSRISEDRFTFQKYWDTFY